MATHTACTATLITKLVSEGSVKFYRQVVIKARSPDFPVEHFNGDNLGLIIMNLFTHITTLKHRSDVS